MSFGSPGIKKITKQRMAPFRFDDEAHLAPDVRAHQLLNVVGTKPSADGKGRY